ncbi:MAG TPA: Asp-tRNA(Asn) amidotransferase subunit GatC [Candidatus Altiarchaeales archaeon]|nr:Asp-tRNA(Asn) amidotransferase subunit GatC [Candidatus Altiarchaeales archaeon]
MIDKKKIEVEGIKLIEEFSKILEKIPEIEETYYVIDLKNILRDDKAAKLDDSFHGKLLRLAPKKDDGYIIAEKQEQRAKK